MSGISIFNSEHYHDPTVHTALTNIGKQKKRCHKRGGFKPVVYVCSPYSGNIEQNTANARRYCRFAVDCGCIPIAPHLFLPQFMSEETERAAALHMNFVFLSKCREIWVFGKRITPGMSEEIKRAKQRKIPIRYFSDEIKEVNESENSLL